MLKKISVAVLLLNSICAQAMIHKNIKFLKQIFPIIKSFHTINDAGPFVHRNQQLAQAIQREDLPAFRDALCAGADYTELAYEFAQKIKNRDMVQLLATKLLFDAISDKQLDKVQEALKKGADVNARGQDGDLYDLSMLAWAMKSNDIQIIKVILDENPYLHVVIRIYDYWGDQTDVAILDAIYLVEDKNIKKFIKRYILKQALLLKDW